MGVNFKAHDDARARYVFERFKLALEPTMASVCPDWLLHHIELRRVDRDYGYDETVEIRLVLKPVGSARVVPDPELLTAEKRLPAP